MRDELAADGEVRFRQRILEGLHGGNAKCVAVPISAVVDIDIGELGLQLREDYNLNEVLRKQFKTYELNFDSLAVFGRNLSNQLVESFEQMSAQDRAKLSGIARQLHKVFERK